MACSVGGQQGPEMCQVIKGRNHFFDAGNGNVYRRIGGAQAGIAFVFRNGDASDVGQEEIDTRNADISRGVLVPQQFTGFQGELLGAGPGRSLKFFMK